MYGFGPESRAFFVLIFAFGVPHVCMFDGAGWERVIPLPIENATKREKHAKLAGERIEKLGLRTQE
jgi:hypothetical protein